MIIFSSLAGNFSFRGNISLIVSVVDNSLSSKCLKLRHWYICNYILNLKMLITLLPKFREKFPYELNYTQYSRVQLSLLSKKFVRISGNRN